uniref:Titin n=1 Tax=Fundulus heteroclitus TaxID=8078 RepID=A0A3Q2NTA9_FUNHE
MIQWRPPKDDGGTPITNYVVEKKDVKKPWEPWSVVSSSGTSTKAKVTRLEKGREYIVRVRAENKIGIGAGLESPPTIAKHMFNPPGPPGFPECSDITENAVTVEWALPDYDGGSPISGYVVERREMTGKWIRVNKTPVLDLRYRVSGLFEGNTYEFRVFAENIAGISEPSLTSDPVKATRAITKPGPPGNPKLKDWSKSYADICWTKPTRDGGSPILGYVVEVQKSGSAQWDRINKDLIKICAYRVPGLIEGMEYRLRIRATNKVGDSDPRELPETILAKDILVPPEVVVDVSCRDSVTVRAGQIISLITRVKGRPDPEITWTKDARVLSREKRTEFNNNYPVCELIINDAIRSDYGKYGIVAKNSSGQEQLVEPEVKVKLDATLVVRAGDSIAIEATVKGKPQPDVKWTKDERTEEIRKGLRHQLETGVDFSKLLITGARRTDSGQYVVTASNSAGTSSAKGTVNVLDRPGPIRDLKVSDITTDRCNLAWEVPEDDGGCDIYNYIIEKCETKRGVWSVHSNAVITNKAKVTRLIEGNEYIFRVRAENKMGPGPAVQSDAIVAGTQFNVPDAPEAPEVTKISKEEMTVQWSDPEKDGGKPIIGYLLEKREEHAIRWSPVNKDPVPGNRFTVTGLLPLHDYQYRVKAVNEIGVGNASKPSRAITAKDAVGKFLSIMLSVADSTKSTVTLSWTKPVSDGGAPLIGYVVEMRAQGTAKKGDDGWRRCNVAAQLIVCEFTVTSLDEKLVYEFRVSAQNQVGMSLPCDLEGGVIPREILEPTEIKEQMGISCVILFL